MSWIRNLTKSIGALLTRRSFSSPSPEVLHAFGAQPSRAGVEVSERTAMSVSSVFACVRNLAEDTAKLPFIVYRDLQPRGRERLPLHQARQLMQVRPNGEQTALEVRQTLIAMAALWGNGRAEIERTKGGRPIALWPIPPWRIRPIRNPKGTLYYAVDGGRVNLAAEDVFDVRGFSVYGILGEMIARVGRDSLGLAIAAERFAAAYFGNGIRTSGVITHPTKLTDKAYENLRGSWDQQYTGVDNSHKTPILEEGATYVPMTTPPNEAQMLETRQFSVEDVARWFRMPPHKIGHLERAQGWSTLESANSDYIIDTLMPWFVRVEQEVKRRLIQSSEADVFGEHLVDAMLRGDTLARYDAYGKALAAGWMNYDEVREKENLNPIPGGFGEKFRGPMNMKPLDVADAPRPVTGPAGPAAATSTKDDGAAQRAYRDLIADAARRVLRTETDKIRRAASKPEFPQWAGAFYTAHADHVRNCINPVSRAFAQADFDAEGYATRAHEELMNATAGVDAGGIAEAVENVVSRWEIEKPAEIARQATEQMKGN